ncbi:hypothetical protein [Saccharopolyspora hattusasensis]|uniref:hypothetical protein n=1 Tax=Saccharopolyspora hattusasensis TaxID=1128679 RepID=UPI003D95BC01
MLGLDYAVGAPKAAAVKVARFDFVVRYVGTPGRRKNNTATEFHHMTTDGADVALVFENRTGDPLAGRAARGQRPRRTGGRALVRLPDDRPIQMAVEQNITTESQMRTVVACPLSGAPRRWQRLAHPVGAERSREPARGRTCPADLTTGRRPRDRERRAHRPTSGGSRRHREPLRSATSPGQRPPPRTRILARAWVRLMWRCWRNGTRYDPALHGGGLQTSEPAAA